MFTIFLLVYAGFAHVPKAEATLAVTIGSVVQVLAMLLGGTLSDRWGRRPVAICAAVAAGAWSAVFFPLVDSHRFGLLVLAVCVGLVCHGVLTGAQSAFYAELFTTDVRYSGVSLGYQTATAAGAAAPLAGTALLRSGGSAGPVALMLAGCLVVTVLGMAIAPETTRTELA